MIISSVNNQIIKEMTKLHQKKYRDQEGRFLVEGYHLYEEAKKANLIDKVFTTDRSIVGQKVTYVTDIVLQKLTQTKHPQGIATVCHKLPQKEVGDTVLILHQVQDPGNVGTLLRSALAFGFDTVVLDNTCDLYNDKVLRSTQGAIFHLNIIEMDAATFMEQHKEHMFLGTAMNGNSMKTIDIPSKVAIILGNEGSGVPPFILDSCDHVVTIPMKKTESLNVAIAGSILMYETVK